MKKIILTLLSLSGVQFCTSQNITDNKVLYLQPTKLANFYFEPLPPNSIFLRHSALTPSPQIGKFGTTNKKKSTVLETAALYTIIGMGAGGLVGWIASPGGNKGDEQSSKGFGAAVGVAAGGAVGFPVGLIVGFANKQKKKQVI